MIGFALIILIMVIANGYVLLELQAVSEAGRTTLTSDVQAIDRAKQLKEILFDEERNSQKYLVSRDQVYASLVADDVRRFLVSLDSLEAVTLDPEEAALVSEIREGHSWLATLIPQVHNRGVRPNSQEILSARLDTGAGTLHALLDRMILINQQTIDRSMHGIEQTTKRSVRVALLMLASALLLAIIAAVVIANTITRPIKDLIRGTEEIALGSFNPVVVRSRDEMAQLGSAVNDLSERLKSLEEHRTELMQHIAHELRTPLTTMLTAHYILTEQRVGHLNAEQLRLLNAIRKNIDKLTQFSYDFLDLAKIEAGMMHFQLEHTDLVPFLEPLVDEARLNARGKSISVKMEAGATPPVLIDRQRFSHVISNLLSNALKYTGDHGNVSISVTPCDTGATVAVRDTGVGIPPEDLPRIFEKFYRVRNTGGAKGTGVGLAIVKAVTEGMGGSVQVLSKPGQGSTFTIQLPSAPPNVPPSGLPKMPTGHGHG